MDRHDRNGSEVGLDDTRNVIQKDKNHRFHIITEGVYPQSEKEVALSADAKELFGIKVGDRITLNTPAGVLEYTVSGFYEDDTEFNDIIEGSCVYMNREAFDEVRSLNGVEASSQFYIRFEKEKGLKKTIAEMKEQYNLTDENVKENTAVLSLLGASTDERVNDLYPLANCLFCNHIDCRCFNDLRLHEQ